LIVPQEGTHEFHTEFGIIHAEPGEIVVIPRGIRFSVNKLKEDQLLKGYYCEVYDGHFEIPDLGPIGANGLADPRHFEVPVAHYDDVDAKDNSWLCYMKFNHTLWQYHQNWTPYDVVAWHGNYFPSKYDLSKYCVINTVSFDHIDPSIFTVLTCQTSKPGVAALDFVIFPPRWSVAENTFRPPYYHRNCMSEYMGLILGNYEAKAKEFMPGGGSLHNCMSGHGPDVDCFEKASTEELKPVRVAEGTLAFMFETCYMLKLSETAANSSLQIVKDDKYWECWQGLKKHFDPSKP